MKKSRFYPMFIFLVLIFQLSLFAQRQGLLLGLRTEIDSDQWGYRTLLVVHQNDSAQIKATTDNLLLLHEDIFWRVGTKRSQYNEWTQDFLWAVPDSEIKYRNHPEVPGIVPERGEGGEGYIHYKITYVGNGYCSFEELNAWSGGFTPSGASNSLAIISLREIYPCLDSWNNIPTSYPKDEKSKKQVYAEVAEHFSKLDMESRELIGIDYSVTVGIQRDTTQWTYIGRAEKSSGFMTGYSEDFQLRQLPPIFDTTQASLEIEYLRNASLSFVDAFSSPDKNTLLVLFQDSIFAYKTRNGKTNFAYPVMEYSIGYNNTVVMLQWIDEKDLIRLEIIGDYFYVKDE